MSPYFDPAHVADELYQSEPGNVQIRRVLVVRRLGVKRDLQVGEGLVLPVYSVGPVGLIVCFTPVRRFQELPAEQPGQEVGVDTEGGHLGVGQRELHPAVIENLSVAILHVFKAENTIRNAFSSIY